MDVYTYPVVSQERSGQHTYSLGFTADEEIIANSKLREVHLVIANGLDTVFHDFCVNISVMFVNYHLLQVSFRVDRSQNIYICSIREGNSITPGTEKIMDTLLSADGLSVFLQDRYKDSHIVDLFNAIYKDIETHCTKRNLWPNNKGSGQVFFYPTDLAATIINETLAQHITNFGEKYIVPKSSFTRDKI